ncbi:nitrilase-related carbon-nitrogen hydrolase [candidate division KSB1 bacterium]
MIVGYYQFKPEFGNIKENLDKIENKLSGYKFDIVVLPELCTTGYQFVSSEELRGYAGEIPGGYASERFVKMAKEFNAHIIAGIPELSDGLLYNSSILAGPGGILDVYKKTHLFFEETLIFEKGPIPPRVTDINGVKIGIIICYDWLFSENFRILSLSGADIIAQPANLVLPYCQLVMRARSIENRIFTITANRIGTEQRGGKPALEFTGQSQVTDVNGDILINSADNDEDFRTVEIDPKNARNKKLTEYNNILEDRRTDLYRDIL